MRHFFYLFVVFLNLAFGFDFSYCQRHYQRVVVKIKDFYAIPIQYHEEVRYVLYSKKPLIAQEVIKSDPFIGLYEIHPKKAAKGYILRQLDAKIQEIPLAVLGFSHYQETKLLQRQKGFLNYAKLDQSIKPNEVLGNICYQIYGIGAEDGLIEKKYLERFFLQQEPYYGSIGVRLSEGNKVKLIDPFFKNNPFLPQDQIISINHKAINEQSDIEWVIANLPYQQEAIVMVLRNQNGKKVKKELKVVVDKLYGGFLLQDSFFESQGIKIDRNLVIRRLSKTLDNGLEVLKRDDKILWIDGRDPRKESGDIFENLKSILSETFVKYGYIEMLISRNGFQFSIKVYPNKE